MSYFDFAKGCLAAGFSGGLSVARRRRGDAVDAETRDVRASQAIMNPLDTLKVRVQVATNPGSLTAFARDVRAWAVTKLRGLTSGRFQNWATHCNLTTI